jgi:hypothetical protein
MFCGVEVRDPEHDQIRVGEVVGAREPSQGGVHSARHQTRIAALAEIVRIAEPPGDGLPVGRWAVEALADPSTANGLQGDVVHLAKRTSE